MAEQRDLADRTFWLAKEEEIKRGETTDIYFINAVKALQAKNLNPKVVMEVYTRKLPYSEPWAVLGGIYEAAKLLEGLPIDVYAMEEAEIFLSPRSSTTYEPVLRIEGRYQDFAVYENPLLGLICTNTSLLTKSVRVKQAAGDKMVLSFGTRRTHPALAPTVERAAYIAGLDGLSNVLGSKLLGVKPAGTMPHALILCFGDQKAAWLAFDEAVSEDTPRIALIDTLWDEKAEAILALETLKDRLWGVRLDTPTSRRGNFRRIIEEVRWELNLRGGEKVKIVVSGGLDEEEIKALKDIVDGFGVGTAITAAPIIDFNAKIVEVEEDGALKPRAKRGDLSGAKEVYRFEGTFRDRVVPRGRSIEGPWRNLLTPLIEDGKIVRRFKTPSELRSELKMKISRLGEAEVSLTT
ncbi:MAG: nicotinate phosphoribosyltransferase [Thaumarchaeota archaeon]|nr:nicotinate phosphoribosyltransferase [Nitrososphaerota archaeon]